LSIAENIFLQTCRIAPDGSHAGSCAKQAREVMARSGPGKPRSRDSGRSAGIGHQQTVEIARNLVGSFRVLILDEPTAMLTAHEASLLFQRIEQLKQQGVALVYISHRLENWPALRNVSRSCGMACWCKRVR